jgi:hypothetical protein
MEGMEGYVLAKNVDDGGGIDDVMRIIIFVTNESDP